MRPVLVPEVAKYVPNSMWELLHSPATMHSIKTTCLHFLIINPWEMNSSWHKYNLPTRQFRAARSLWIQFFDSR